MALVLSALDLVPLVRGGTSGAAIRDSVELARVLDRLGYERLWYAEHHNMPGITTTTPEMLIAHVGPSTSRIRLGAGGVMLPNHSPLKIAESYRLLEAIHPGRIDLGIGRAPGTDTTTALALRRSRAALSPEDFPTQLEELYAFDEGGFPGDHPFAKIRAMPDDVRLPPIWLLGSTDFSARMAGRLGLGFAFAGHFSPDPPELALKVYRDGFTRGKRETPHAILALSVFCADTDEAAHRMAASMQLAFVEIRSGRASRLASPDEVLARGFSATEEATLDFVRRLQIVGTPEKVKARIEATARRTRADEVMIVTHAFDPKARVRSFELVAEAFAN